MISENCRDKYKGSLLKLKSFKCMKNSKDCRLEGNNRQLFAGIVATKAIIVVILDQRGEIFKFAADHL